jgi:hypothetical protein
VPQLPGFTRVHERRVRYQQQADNLICAGSWPQVKSSAKRLFAVVAAMRVDKRINKIQMGRDIDTEFEGLNVCLIDD